MCSLDFSELGAYEIPMKVGLVTKFSSKTGACGTDISQSFKLFEDSRDQI